MKSCFSEEMSLENVFLLSQVTITQKSWIRLNFNTQLIWSSTEVLEKCYSEKGDKYLNSEMSDCIDFVGFTNYNMQNGSFIYIAV